MEKVITPEFRASYAHLFKPQKNDLNGKMEFSVVAIFPKGSDLTGVKAVAAAALAEKWGADQTKWPQNLKKPFRKCSEKWTVKDGKQIIPAGYEDGDAIFITLKANEDYRPSVVDAKVQPIIEPREFYSGCYAKASVRAYTYDQKGNKGVSIGLVNVQKTRDGEPLGGGSSRAEDDFQPVVGASEGGAAAGAGSVFDD